MIIQTIYDDRMMICWRLHIRVDTIFNDLLWPLKPLELLKGKHVDPISYSLVNTSPRNDDLYNLETRFLVEII